jgi:Lrp/AsnC family transcriptional regulator, regulator for asnA, asnC and gidA
MSGILLDELDHKIIETLGKDARVSNRQIATAFGVTEGTIRTRIKRLQTEGLLQFTVVTDFKLLGSPNLVMFGIQADIAQVPSLAKALAAIPDLGCVMVLLGRYNLLVMGLFTSLQQVNELIQKKIRVLPGVRSVKTSVSIDNFKYDVRVARITSGNKPL